MTTSHSLQLLTRKQVADILGIKEKTLANWKSTGCHNLPHIKIGKLVRYKISELEKFLEKGTELS